jgi:hypothetical protein
VGVELAFFAIKFLGVGGCFALYSDIWPFRGIFSVDLQPLIQARLGIGLYGIGWAFRLANAAINAFIGVDHQHVFAFIEAIYGANFHAIHVFALNAVFGDDVGHNGPIARLMTGHLAEGIGLCIHFLSCDLFVEQPCFWRRSTLFGLRQYFYNFHIIVERKGKNVIGLNRVAGFTDTGAVYAHMTSFYKFSGQAAVFHKPCVDEPFVDALCQFYPCFICALRAAKAANGEFGSIGFSGRGGRGGGRSG